MALSIRETVKGLALSTAIFGGAASANAHTTSDLTPEITPDQAPGVEQSVASTPTSGLKQLLDQEGDSLEITQVSRGPVSKEFEVAGDYYVRNGVPTSIFHTGHHGRGSPYNRHADRQAWKKAHSYPKSRYYTGYYGRHRHYGHHYDLGERLLEGLAVGVGVGVASEVTRKVLEPPRESYRAPVRSNSLPDVYGVWNAKTGQAKCYLNTSPPTHVHQSECTSRGAPLFTK